MSGICKLEKGDLKINIVDLLDSAGGEVRKQLVQALACEDELFKEIVEQLRTGFTTDGNYTYNRVIQESRRRILEMTGALATKAIEDLVRQRDNAFERVAGLEKDIREIRDAWPEGTEGYPLPQGKVNLHRFNDDCHKDCVGKSYDYGHGSKAGPPYNSTHDANIESWARRDSHVAEIFSNVASEVKFPDDPLQAQRFRLAVTVTHAYKNWQMEQRGLLSTDGNNDRYKVLTDAVEAYDKVAREL